MPAEEIPSSPPPPHEIRRLRSALLVWFRRQRRDLPWRRTRDPYLVWVSEVMLQQTTVRVVVPYFERFVLRFPTIQALAAGGEDEVLALWSGLGYYRRARNLLRAARHLVEAHEGRFPRTLEGALAIPGVGLYTASAILSITANALLPVVDGNVRRVLARLFVLRSSRESTFLDLAGALLHPRRPGEWNEALMELGATVCTPRAPTCPTCPLREGCRAHGSGEVDLFPAKVSRRSPVQLTIRAALVEREGRILLVRRADGNLLGRLWELPQTPMESGTAPRLETAVLERYGIAIEAGDLVAVASHAITFRRIRLEGFAARLTGSLPTDADRCRFVSADDLARLPLSSMTRKLAAGLTNRQLPLKL